MALANRKDEGADQRRHRIGKPIRDQKDSDRGAHQPRRLGDLDVIALERRIEQQQAELDLEIAVDQQQPAVE